MVTHTCKSNSRDHPPLLPLGSLGTLIAAAATTSSTAMKNHTSIMFHSRHEPARTEQTDRMTRTDVRMCREEKRKKQQLTGVVHTICKQGHFFSSRYTGSFTFSSFTNYVGGSNHSQAGCPQAQWQPGRGPHPQCKPWLWP